MTRTLSAVALALLVGCQPNPPMETATALPDVRRLQIDATLETVPFFERLAVGARERWPSIDIQTQTVSHTVLMRRIAQGEVPYGLTLHAPEDKTLWSAPLAYDGLVVLVNSENTVPSLSPHDLRRIYTGLTTTWETGAAIMVFSWASGSGLRAEFERLVMGQRRLVTTAQILPTAAAIQTQIAQTPGGIAYLPYSQWQPDESGRTVAIDGILPTIETLTSGQYPLRLTVYLVGQEAPTGEYAEFLAWMQSQNGQEHLSPDYVPLIPD